MIARFTKLPWVLQAGLASLAVGVAGDMVYHSFSGLPEKLGDGLHLLTFVGMACTMAGVLFEAFSRHPGNRAESSNSARRTNHRK